MQQEIVGPLGSGRGQFEVGICVQVVCLRLLSGPVFPWDSKHLRCVCGGYSSYSCALRHRCILKHLVRLQSIRNVFDLFLNSLIGFYDSTFKCFIGQNVY